MAFSAAGLKSFARTTSNGTIWSYKSADTLATIKGGGYFNSQAASMRLLDIILTVGDSVPATLCVSSNSGTVVAVTESAGAGGGGTPTPGSVGTTELADDGVTYAKFQNASATDKVLLRATAGAGDWEEGTLTATGRSILDDTSTAAVLTTIGAQPVNANLTAAGALTGAADRLPYFTGVGALSLATFTAAGRAVVDDADAAAQRVTLGVSSRSIQWRLDGGGAVIPTGVYGEIEIPFACTITAWRLLADQVGSLVVDVWADSYANYPPTIADTITGSELPTLTASIKNEDTNLTTWTTAVTAGTILRCNVNSATTITRALFIMRITI